MSKIKAENQERPAFFHQPVLLKQTIKWLNVRPGQLYVDATLGGGGHTQAILAKGGRVLGLDRDPEAISWAHEHLQSACLAPNGKLRGHDAHYQLIQANFVDLKKVLVQQQAPSVSGILLDLGVSSHQLGAQHRGFSFQQDEILDMRMDPDLTVLAADLVNGLWEQELADLFFKLGDEKLSRPIAKAIVKQRKKEPIQSTRQLASLVTSIYKRRYSTRSKIHPASKVFMALRIAVNDELNNLRSVLPQAIKALRSGGRLVVISFHGLEDKIVKDFFKKGEEKGWLKILTKKPIVPQLEEKQANPRSRSAKLRAAEKI